MKKLTHAEFATAIASGAVIIDFFAEWCPPCKALTPMLENFQLQLGDKITIYKFDVDQEQSLSHQQGVTAMPTLQFFQDGKLLDTVRGLDPQAIVAGIEKILA